LRMPSTIWAAALCLLLSPLLAGCAWFSDPSGAMAVTSQADASRRLEGNFDTAYYRYDDKNTLTVVLLDGPEDEPNQAAAIRLLWAPNAGRTPIDSDATNATVQYVVFADRRTAEGYFHEAGIYSGAGYLHLDNTPGGSSLSGDLWQADLLLTDRSERFKDLLGQSRITGSFTARRDDAKVNTLLRQLNIRVTDRLGYPRLVRAD